MEGALRVWLEDVDEDCHGAIKAGLWGHVGVDKELKIASFLTKSDLSSSYIQFSSVTLVASNVILINPKATTAIFLIIKL